ncbi:MAG: flagellar hook assembly protein FlgD [Candidatus Sumerlaeota bacterium]|nr:flagellar hook assembly protein FlgD [Candidatus Sumerlaeota bacterium]
MNASAIASINSASVTAAQSSKTSGTTMGKDEFMKLLVAQLTNQDPLSPADPKDFAAQLAQFSSLEQQMNMNATLSNLAALESSINSAQAASFIGKEITALGKSVSLKNGQGAAIHYELAGDARTVRIQISDASGKTVRTIEAGAKSSGDQQTAWDGKDDAGATAPNGVYTFSITAKDSQDKAVDVSTFSSGIVDGITFDQGITYLNVGGQMVQLGDVMEIHNPGSASASLGASPKFLSSPAKTSSANSQAKTTRSTSLTDLIKRQLAGGR